MPHQQTLTFTVSATRRKDGKTVNYWGRTEPEAERLVARLLKDRKLKDVRMESEQPSYWRKNPMTTSRLGWMLGLAAAGAGALGLLVLTTKKAAAATAPGLVQAPVKPGDNLKLALAKGGTIDLIVPVGSMPVGAEGSPNVFSPEPSPAPLTFRFSAFAAGQGAINVRWTDASGATQDAFVAVTVS